MDIQLIFGLLASLFFIAGLLLYVRDVYRGKVRVAVVSIFMLALIGMSQLGSLFAEQLWYVIPFTASAIVMNLLIVILGFKNAHFHFKTLDAIVLFGGIIGLLLWYVTDDAAYNIYVLTAVMLLSVIPMIMKTFRDPSSETSLPWKINLIGTVLLALTITSPQPVAWLVQIRQVILSVLMNLAIARDSKTK